LPFPFPGGPVEEAGVGLGVGLGEGSGEAGV
jgi:hypothetical protein